jgi:hypothetical protein
MRRVITKEVVRVAYSTATTTPKYVPLGVRVVLTLVGAAGLIVGAFLTWIDGIRGTDLSIDALWRTTFHTTTQFLQTIGFASIVVGLVAIVGLAFASGWLTRLAGAVGIVGFVLFAIQVFRDSGSHTWGAGGWLALAGSIVVLIAGFLGGHRTVVEHSADHDDDA